MHRHQSFKWCNSQHNFSRNGWGDLGVQAKPEFVYQNCFKLIEHGRAHKHSCAFKSLFIQNTSSITNFLPTSLTTFISQKLRLCSKLSELNLFPHKCLLPDVILNEGVNKLRRRKNFLWQKFFWLFERCLCIGNVSITHRGSFFLLSFYGESLVISRISSNFEFLYLGTSHFGCPTVFQK